jgi:1-acyl-sn-glycerol-3-phosphate acyltransferase
MVRKILQPFYTAFVLGTFVASVLILFPIFVLLGAFNHRRARHTIFAIIRHWSTAWLWLIGMPVRRLGALPPHARYVVVANHISYLDALVIFPAIPGYFRPLGKKEISRIPLVGFIYKQLVIMVDRSSVHSRAKSMRLLWRVLHHDGHILIFPEGTFNETDKPLKEFYDGAFRLAINTQAPILPILFPDTVNRWHYSAWWKLWPGRNRAIYLAPIPVQGLTLADLPQLKLTVSDAMQKGLIASRV